MIISKLFASEQYYLIPDTAKIIESYILLYLVIINIPKCTDKLSALIIWLLIPLSYIPMLTLYGWMDTPRTYMYLVSGFWLLLIYGYKGIPEIKLRPIPPKLSFIIRNTIFIFTIASTFSIILYYFGVQLNFNLAKVYEIRSEYVELNIPFAGYFFNWAAYVINPIFFILFLRKRNWFSIAIILLSQVLLFSCTGHKTFLFALPFVTFISWISTTKKTFFWYSAGLTGVILCGILSYLLISDVWISSLFTRRTLLVPAKICFYYYDFFSNHDFTFLSNSILKSSFSYPYDLIPPKLISHIYFPLRDSSSNTGLVGDAYMNFGSIGLLVWGTIFIFIMKIFDSCAKNKSISITSAAVAMPAIILTNSALLTTFLTHGLFIAAIMLYLLPTTSSQNNL